MRFTTGFVLAIFSAQLACSPHSASPPAQAASPGASPASNDQASDGAAGHMAMANSATAPNHHMDDAHSTPQGSGAADTTVSSSSNEQTASGSPAPIVSKIEPRSGSSAEGTITLTASPEGVRVQVRVSHVTPGAHGLHFHETGDCSAQDAASAKGHYNPTKQPHALPATSHRHLGDMGNITVGKNGEGTLDITIKGATLVPNAPNTLLGTAVILHEKNDDGSQPSGNSGARIGCAVIAR